MSITDAEKDRRLRTARISGFILVACATFFVRFFRQSSGTLRTYLAESFSINSTVIGSLSSLYFVPYVIMQIPMGYFADVFGIRMVIAVGMMLTAVGAVVFGTAQTVAVLYIGRVLIGLGVSAPVVCSQRFLADWFRQDRIATWGGISGFIGTLGSLCAQYPLAALVEIITWRHTFILSAAICCVLGLLVFLFVKDRKRFEDVGRKEVTAPRATGAEPFYKLVANVAKNPHTWPLFLVLFVHMGLNAIYSTTFAVPYLEDVFGMNAIEATKYTTFLTVGSICGGLLTGAISDRLKSRVKPMVLLTSMDLATWLLSAYAINLMKNPAVLLTVMFMNGIAVSTTPIVFQSARELNDPRYVGVAISTINTCGMAASSIFPTVFGRMLDKNSTLYSGAELYTKTFFIFIVLAVVMVVAATRVTETPCRNRYAELVLKVRPQETQDI